MSADYYSEFKKGDLIKLRDGIVNYPYYKSLEDFLLDPKLNMFKFGSDQLVILDKVYNDSKELIGYECLCGVESFFVMNVEITKTNILEVGFCYVTS